MKKATQFLFIIFFIFFSHYLFSQNTSKTDSLENLFEQTNNDSLKNEILNKLYTEYLQNNWGMAINTAKNGIAFFSDKRPDYAFNWYHKLGNIYLEQGFYTLSLNAYTKALSISDKENLNTGSLLLDIAKLYYYRKDFDKSIEIYNNALPEFKKLKQTNKKEAEKGIAKTYNKLGIVYELKGELDTSKNYFLKALKLRLKINDAKDIADSYTSLGYFSNVIQEYDSAMYYFSKGIQLSKSSGNMYYFNDLHLFRSKTFSKIKDFGSAKADIDTAEQFALNKDKAGLARIYYYSAIYESEKDDYNAFLTASEKALQYSDSFNMLSVENKVLQLLVQESAKHNDYNTAYKYQKQLSENIQLNDTEKMLQLEQNFELDAKKRQNLELAQANKGLQKDINLFQLLFLSGILILLFLILSLILNARKNKKIKRALQLAEEEKNKADKAQKELLDTTEIIRSQAALAEILRNVTGKERSIEDFLQDALNKLLALPWLDVVSKGSIFLTNAEGNLNMVAEKDLGEVAVRCALIKPGECLCGKALSEKKMQFCNHINHDHEIRFKNMTEHGHYNLPIMMQDDVLGVLNLYTKHKHQKNDSEIKFLQIVSDTLASVIHRKKNQNEILQAKKELEKQKAELEKKNKSVRLYLTQLEQKNREQEILNQTILAQKKAVEQTKKQLEEKAKEQEALTQKLFAQKLEVEQRNSEVELYAKQLEEKGKEQESINQKLFAQKLEVEQRNTEVQDYLKQIEKSKLEQEKLNQQLFAQKLEVEQRNFETEQYSKQLEEKGKEQEALNQQIFAQKLEVEQRNFETELYSKQLEEKAKEQEALNQKLFAQKLEVEQRNDEIQQYLDQIEKQKKEQEALNQKLFAQSLEVDQKRFEVELYAKEIEELKEKAENSLNHLNDSINYSKYIQNSLLPDHNYINNNLPGDFFIYFNPKETIGGDFYYFKRTGDWLIFAVADCTGHGIPGALITMLGMSFLDDIVTQNLTNSTGGGLNILRQRVKDTFHSYGNSLENKNGLDIALCAVNLQTNTMQYSGAFNSLILFRNEELIEYKATRNPIGYYPVEKDFETTEIKLQKDDIFYLFTDGYADQVGGEKNRKFSKRQFKDLLYEIHKYPMKKQHVFLEKIMQKWMGNNPQVDDITVMGIKWDNEI